MDPMAGMLKKIWTGGRDRPSRLHDWKGNRVDFGGLMYLPRCVTSYLAIKALGYRAAVPWLSYRAVRHFEKMLRPEWSMLEFGSGMSTVWFARRCGKMVSIESDSAWFDKVKATLRERGVTNVDYRLRPPGEYPNLNEWPDCSFDFILVDGIERRECARSAIPKVRPGGYIYLDNSDMAESTYNDNFHEAELLLLDAVRARGGETRYFVDFSPGCLFASQGLLVRL